MEIIPDLPSGPLDIYRQRASFDWKKMKLHLISAEDIKIMVSLKVFFITLFNNYQ